MDYLRDVFLAAQNDFNCLSPVQSMFGDSDSQNSFVDNLVSTLDACEEFEQIGDGVHIEQNGVSVNLENDILIQQAVNTALSVSLGQSETVSETGHANLPPFS